MKIDTDLLQKLMLHVERQVDDLLLLTRSQDNEITYLKQQNQKLTDNYSTVLEQIDAYVKELEEIKNSLLKK